MAPRANWKGYLKLSLVSSSFALFPATSTSERVRFNIINRKTGLWVHRHHHQVADAETGDEFEHCYEQALANLIRAKQSGRSPPSAPTPRPGNVVNLVDALRRRVKAERRMPAARATRSKAGRRATTTKRRRLKKAG
jgi:non-homologous end joining protein Ku